MSITKHALMTFSLLLAIANPASGQEDNFPQELWIELTGIVLTSDHRCPDTKTHDDLCRSSDWALASEGMTILLYGDKTTLERFRRKRVSVSGLLQQESIVEYGTKMMRRKIVVRSIESNELSKDAIEALVNHLKAIPWRGPENHCSPTCWDFAFTDQ